MSRNLLDNSALGSLTPTSRVLKLLKTRGTQTASDLGAALGVTAEAARQQLGKLATEGLAVAGSEPQGVGRPSQVWSLTAAGHARFPDTHTELAISLIRSIRAELGEPILDRLIMARAEEAVGIYAEAVAGLGDVGARVSRLAEIRNREGYMAEWRADGDGFLLIENHCPICEAATACRGLCGAELDTFRKVLGNGVAVEREEHILGGDRRCTYRIRWRA